MPSSSGALSFGPSDFSRVNIGGAMSYRASKQVTISTVKDTSEEDAEMFTVSMTAVTTSASPTDSEIVLGNPSTRTVTIEANDEHLVTNVTMGSIGEHSAAATIELANPSSSSQTVYLRFRKRPCGAWSDPPLMEDTPGTSVEVTLDMLDSNTPYQVQASLVMDFSEDVEPPTFSTLSGDPTVSGITFEDVEQTEATALIAMANLDGSEQTVRLRYRTPPSTGSWSSTRMATSRATQAAIELTGLISGKEYGVEATLATSFSTGAQSEKFTTDPPEVTSVTVADADIDQTAATVSATVSAPNGSKVHLRHGRGGINWSETESKVVRQGAFSTAFALSGLSSDAPYTIEASYDKGFVEAVQSRTFVTNPLSADSISVPMATVERTTVTVVTAISEPNGRSQQVRLGHRTPPDTGARSAPQFGSTSTASIDITGLTSGSEYEVEATLASDFAAGVRSARFMTLPPAAESVDVSDAGITQTAATATVTIADPNGQPQTVRLRYRSPPGTGAWITAPNETSLDLTATFDLTRLIAGRRYEVEAALASNFSTGTQSTTFTTDAPTVDSVVVEAGSITQTSATIAVRVNNSNASEVDLRYRVDGTNSWSAIDSTPVAVCASSATFTLRSLTSGRTYRVEASYDITFRTATEFATFDTLAPAVTAVEIDDRTVTRTTAAVVLSVSTANGSDVHLRFSLDGLNWSMATPASVSPGESGAAFSLTGLTSGSEYTVQAAYDQLFRDGVKTRNFTTFPPTLIGIQATSAAETSASMEATIADPNGAEQIVFLRYRTSGRSWSNPPQPASTRGASATFTLLGLSASTQYQLQASRDRSFNTGMQPTTFSTLSAGPSASQVSIENAEQTRVSARIAIANADGTEQTVRLRYRTPAGNGSWGAANPATSSNQEVTIDLTDLVSGSEYEVEATLAQSFTTGVQSRKFETDPPTVDSIEVVTKSALSATLDVNVEEPNGSDVHLRYGVSDTDSWTSADPRIVNRNASVARFNRSSLISGREYSVGASYDEAFQDRCVVTSDVFSTDPLRVDAVSEEEVTDTDAKIMVDVVAPNGAEVHLRYRSAGGSWQSESQIVAPLRNGNSPQGSATFTLSSLAPDTNYVVEASFDQFFAKDVKSTAFTTFETGFVAGPTIITGTGTGSGGGGGGGSGGGPPPYLYPH